LKVKTINFQPKEIA